MHKNTIVRLIYKLFSQTFVFLKKYYYESKTPKEEEDPEASGRGLALVVRLHAMRAHGKMAKNYLHYLHPICNHLNDRRM